MTADTVVNTFALQQESPVFESTSWLTPFCVEVAHSPCMGSLQMLWLHRPVLHPSQINWCSKLTTGRKVSVNGCLSVDFVDRLATLIHKK